MTPERYQTAFKLYPYERSPDQDRETPVRHPVVIVGGGPVGMGLALDLGQRGVPCVVLDDHEGVGTGSRAICFAKRTLEIADRLGAGEKMVEKGVVWNKGRVYRRDREIYSFDLLPEDGHKRPAFINLQQPYFEKFLVEQIREEQRDGAPIEIRGKNAVVGVKVNDDHVALDIQTPDGPYSIAARWLVACDGARSPVRDMMGLGFEGRVFEDNFLIADIVMNAEFPVERRFWFDPSFNPNQTALMHKQPDNVWRLDFQLGWDIDRSEELKETNIMRRVKAMIGDNIEFELEWTSIYTFQCCSMEEYRHGPVFFAGDSAHQVSPFGARGCNGGMQDVDNLAWKLASVFHGESMPRLLDTYQTERKHAANENIMNSTRTADFLTPRNYASELFRDATLDLAEHTDFARKLANAGRLSVPATYDGSPLNSVDHSSLPQSTRPGSPALDAPIADGWLLDKFDGQFVLLAINTQISEPVVPNLLLIELSAEPNSHLAERYLGDEDQAVYLIRPDQHIAARWGSVSSGQVEEALKTALGKD